MRKEIITRKRSGVNKRKHTYDLTVYVREYWGYCTHTYESFTYLPYFRHPKTFAERREADALLYDEDCRFHNIKARGRRNVRNLPSNWDDIYAGNHHAKKSWKHYSRRRKQWKIDEE